MLADMFVKKIVSKSTHARSRLEKWIEIDHEWVGRAGWVLLTNMAMDSSSDLTDQELGGYLDRIEREIQEARNLTRDAMNSSLIAIGIRSAAQGSRPFRPPDGSGRLWLITVRPNAKHLSRLPILAAPGTERNDAYWEPVIG